MFQTKEGWVLTNMIRISCPLTLRKNPGVKTRELDLYQGQHNTQAQYVQTQSIHQALSILVPHAMYWVYPLVGLRTGKRTGASPRRITRVGRAP